MLAVATMGWSQGASSVERPDAAGVLADLTPAQRVGQLFLVSVEGTTLGPESPLLDLVRAGSISGVLLSAENGNFAPLSGPAGATQRLIAQLRDAAGPAPSPAEPEATDEPAAVPLLVAFKLAGDGTPWSQQLQDYPSTPSQMAIGATWDPDLAREVGQELGATLEQLGVNLLIGPSLDVLGDPRLGGPSDLGVGSFGGDPYWTGVLGRAYIEGIHAGSDGRVGVVVTHFPGLGASDRAAAEDVATVRRTLDQLQGFELQPFAAVATSAPGESDATADGMLTAHIRFQGLQGNIRDTTEPVSLDAEAFVELTAAEPIATWRADGGVMVSDSLGSKAIRRFLDPSERTFSAQGVARDAFLAGNDLMLLEHFRSTSDPDEWTTIRGTLAYFVQRYQEDALFAQRVDEAATRVLALKLRLYGGSFEGNAASATPRQQAPSGDVEFRVARSAATLVSPTVADVRARLGKGPQLADRMVLFTDTRRARECTTCSPVPGVDPQALGNVILSLYGGGTGTAQIRSWNVTSFATADLAAYLGETPLDDPSHPIARAEDVDSALNAADWVVFVVERGRPEEFGSDALKLLLNMRPDLVAERKLVVFALDVPYDLDATDISKIDAMYALYSRGSAFLNVAARLLFQELPASGDLPVSVPAIGYDLIEALSPNPGQVIGLSVLEKTDGAGTPGAEGFRINDAIQVTTDVILDANGHAVPDGTPVEFSLGYPGELPSSLESRTQDGVATISTTLGRLGLLTITAQSEPARSSDVLQLNVQENMPAFVTVIAPTALPTLTIEPSGAGATPTPKVGIGTAGGQEEQPGVGFGGLLVGLVGAAGASALAHRYGSGSATTGRGRVALVTLVACLVGYNYVALGFPGTAAISRALGFLAPGIIGIVVGLAAWGCWVAWSFARRGPRQRS
jgi:beta-N-acetylhexosaminidase